MLLLYFSLGNKDARSSNCIRQHSTRSIRLQLVYMLFDVYFQNCQNKTILEIATELNSLQEKGAKGQLGLNDLTGGTFTISNIGIVSIIIWSIKT